MSGRSEHPIRFLDVNGSTEPAARNGARETHGGCQQSRSASLILSMPSPAATRYSSNTSAYTTRSRTKSSGEVDTLGSPGTMSVRR